ncbi:type IV pilin protein [Candidatus Avelusimicrobium fimicolum]|uniref:type IV pilin protein n=1 Tax=Candidatus Avelusimicrobium fimicolum TaxID=3416216 RepID=UPI003D0F8DDD
MKGFMNTLFLSSSWKVVVQDPLLLMKWKTTDTGQKPSSMILNFINDRFPNPAGRQFLGNDNIIIPVRIATAGFTLIELLVVVLIIGILAGVALPQYQKAVAKARYTQMITAGKSLKEAMELYYMANGDYPFFWSDLDITYPGCSEGTGRYMLWCDKFAVDMFAGSDKNLVFYDIYGIENNGVGKDTGYLGSHTQATYRVWLDQSANPGKTSCNSRIAGLCQSMGF